MSKNSFLDQEFRNRLLQKGVGNCESLVGYKCESSWSSNRSSAPHIGNMDLTPLGSFEPDPPSIFPHEYWNSDGGSSQFKRRIRKTVQLIEFCRKKIVSNI